MRKLFAAIALAGVALLTFQPAAHATGDNNPHPKVWVCKYVGQPGDYETLKAGKQPIQVDDHSAGLQIGDDFADGQTHSVVIDIVTPENTDEHNDYTGAATCPSPPTTTQPPTSTTVSSTTSTTAPPSTTEPSTSTTTTTPSVTSTTQVPTTTTSPPVESTTTIPEETTTSEPVSESTTTAPVVTTVPPTTQPASTTTRPPHGVTTTQPPGTSTSSTPVVPSSNPGTVPPVALAFTGSSSGWQVFVGLWLPLIGFCCLAYTGKRRNVGR